MNSIKTKKKANADKCHVLVTRDNDVTTKIGEFHVKNSREEKFPGVKIDTKIKNHVSSLCQITRHSLAKVVHFMDPAKRKSQTKGFITSQFNYCPLIWMIYSR